MASGGSAVTGAGAAAFGGDAGNVLNPQTAAELPAFDGLKVVYADGCKIGRERLRELGITFKQIPYQIKVR